MRTSSSVEFAERVKAFAGCGLIAIDGYHGSGKTTLSRMLAYFLQYDCVNLDLHLTPGDNYVSSLDFTTVTLALKRRPLIVEGICLLAVLERFNIEADCLIYVDSPDPRSGTLRGDAEIAAQVREYHARWNPRARAHYLYTPSWGGGDPMAATRADIDIAYINAKTKLAITLASGGIATLLVGLMVLLYGVTGQDHTLLKFGMAEVSATGLGGVILSTSAVWAFLSYQCRPKYSQILQSTERYSPDGNILERDHYEASTMPARGVAEGPFHPVSPERR